MSARRRCCATHMVLCLIIQTRHDADGRAGREEREREERQRRGEELEASTPICALTRQAQGFEPVTSAFPGLHFIHCVTTEVEVAEFQRKIKEAFEVFDHESNNTVDVREIGTIIRSLGCCPTEAELHDLIAEVEEDEPTGFIRFEKFLPVMTNVLLERRYRPIPEDTLLRAFEVLDTAKRGFLSKEELVKYMTEEGEPFSQEEMEEMLSAAIDPESNSLHYKDYLTMMVIDEN
ncbi:dynein regulatory complex protein 8 isoform X2 [Saccopteryx bilineata]|uniref:dynein regulatory complex protein 8 isoform X2 n=1 Tax=Saccopteryx bilineata TaxID=59482 RepID=UPI00338FF5F5